jgi:hypothetical protein
MRFYINDMVRYIKDTSKIVLLVLDFFYVILASPESVGENEERLLCRSAPRNDVIIFYASCFAHIHKL